MAGLVSPIRPIVRVTKRVLSLLAKLCGHPRRGVVATTQRYTSALGGSSNSLGCRLPLALWSGYLRSSARSPDGWMKPMIGAFSLTASIAIVR